LILNENQTFMMDNQDLPHVIGQFAVNDNTIVTNTKEEKLQMKQISLLKYIKARQQTNTLSDYDRVLYSYLADDVKEQLNELDKKNRNS